MTVINMIVGSPGTNKVNRQIYRFLPVSICSDENCPYKYKEGVSCF